MSDQIPLALRDTPPYPADWVRLIGVRLDGLPDGYHTGGAWHNRATGEVWKPLDGRPNPLCSFHLSTQEAEALILMAGEHGFSRNWRVETTGHLVDGATATRRWLVRQHAVVVGWPQPPPHPGRRAQRRAGFAHVQPARLGRQRRHQRGAR